MNSHSGEDQSFTDGVIVGSALVTAVRDNLKKDWGKAAGQLARKMRQACALDK